MKVYTKYNFHKHTFCLFQQVTDTVLIDLKLGYKSNSGSEYYFTETGVYRKSNHWGRAANCRWRLQVNLGYKNQSTLIGFARWTDFYSNNETEKLFYIEAEVTKSEVQFNHRDNPNYMGQILRDATETSKRIKEIKSVLQTNSWAKHLVFDDFEEIKCKMLTELCNTNESFVNLKSKFKY